MKKYLLTMLFLVITIGSLSILAKQNSQIDTNNTESKRIISTTPTQVNKRIAVDEFYIETQKPNVVILDIRTPEEYNNGHIDNSINIDFYATNFRTELDKLDKTVEYNIYCNSGNRSATALQMMKEMGFENVLELEGGIQAWNKSNKTICTDC